MEKTPEQIKKEMEFKATVEKKAKEMETKKLEMEKILKEKLIPSLKENTKNLLEAGMLAERITGLIQQQFNKTSETTKIKQLKLENYIDELWSKDNKKENLEVYSSYKKVAEKIGEVSIADFMQVVQTFGQKINDFAFNINKEKQLEDVFNTEPKTEDKKTDIKES